MNEIDDLLQTLCEYDDLHCLAIVGNDEMYNVTKIGDYDKIGESLYFALTNNEKLLKVVAESVRIATEVLEF